MLELSPDEIKEAKQAALKQQRNEKLTATEAKKLEAYKVHQAIAVLSSIDNPQLKTRYNDAIESLMLKHLQQTRPKFFNRLLGIQNKQRNDMAERYDFRCGPHQEKIDFLDVIDAMRKLITKHARFIGKSDDEESPHIEEARVAKLIREREKIERQIEELDINLQDRRGQLKSIDIVKQILDLTAGAVRKASLEMQKQGFDEAYQLLEDALSVSDANAARLLNDRTC